jgi:hypothetical protein
MAGLVMTKKKPKRLYDKNYVYTEDTKDISKKFEKNVERFVNRMEKQYGLIDPIDLRQVLHQSLNFVLVMRSSKRG